MVDPIALLTVLEKDHLCEANCQEKRLRLTHGDVQSDLMSNLNAFESFDGYPLVI
jgi:hypothetical protein